MHRALAVLLCFALTLAARAEIRVVDVDYRHGDVALRGTLAYDDTIAGKRPGIIVAHEWWGCNDFAKARAAELARLGYIALAIDMYGSGKTTESPEQAGQWASTFMADRALMRQRAQAGLAVLTQHELTDTTRLAAIGYCFGGTVALELARAGADLDVAVAFHAGKITTPVPADSSRIRGRVLILNGSADPFLTPEERAAFHKEMRDARVDYVFIDYAGALHSFTNPGADRYNIPGVAYQQTADRRSWAHMRQMFDEAFAAPAPNPAP